MHVRYYCYSHSYLIKSNENFGCLALWIESCCSKRRNATQCVNVTSKLRQNSHSVNATQAAAYVCVFARAYAGDPVCARGSVSVCVRAHATAVFARHRVRVRRARHVIERNPPPETRGSEGDSFAYKASANICPEQSWWKHQLGARHGNLWRIIFYFPLDLSLGHSASRCKPGETHLRAALQVDVTPTASIILELSSDRRYSGWVQSYLGVI